MSGWASSGYVADSGGRFGRSTACRTGRISSRVTCSITPLSLAADRRTPPQMTGKRTAFTGVISITFEVLPKARYI